ncbi:TPA: DNA-binding protein [bacterium]|nr:DNA-binding protein [bacterium]
MHKDFENISLLLDVYKNLLTDYQVEIMELYFNEDWSLKEIAENKNITRNAVLSTIKRVSKTLTNYEEKLGLIRKYNRISDIIKNSDLSREEKDKILNVLHELI